MPAIGDNSMQSEVADRALFFHHFNAIKKARAKVDEARAAEKVLRKQAKVDGIILKDVDFGLYAISVEDEQLVVHETTRRVRLLRWMGLAIGEEPELDFEREPIVERASREGAAAGRLALKRESPYDPTTEPGRAWLEHYDAAQSEVADNWKEEMQRRQKVSEAEKELKAKGRGGEAGSGDAKYDA